MRRANAVTLLILVCTACLAGAQQHRHLNSPKASLRTNDLRAWDLFSKTMQYDRYVPCKGLITQREGADARSMMRLWAEQSGDGHLKLVVLSPLSKQGIIAIDDGNQWLTYHPDENKVLLQPSPRSSAAVTLSRISLAKKNYDLSIDSTTCMVAGKKAYSILAIPRFKEMPARRYCIDPKKNFLLRMEVLTKGDAKVLLDTKSMEYLASVPEEDFVLEPKGRAKLESYASPARIPLGKEGKHALGFMPVVPSSLPFGFIIEKPQLGGRKRNRFVAVRITDGLVNATVYEWNKKNPSLEFGTKPHDREAQGMGLRVVGEVPEAVMAKVLDSFLKEALRKVEPYLISFANTETTNQVKTLNFEEKELSFGNVVCDLGDCVLTFSIEKATSVSPNVQRNDGPFQ